MKIANGMLAALAAGSVLALAIDATGALPVKAVRPEQWLNSVIPLPKEAAIQQEVTLPAGALVQRYSG